MFETEVEEWADEMYPCDGQAQQYLIMGAEFGYNKANEWHYVKDGNLPKDDENFICMLENGYKLECYYDPTTKRWYDNYFHHDIEYGYYQSKVIAWKEIVFPKEIAK